MELLKQQLEALIFCSEQSISLEEISASLKISFDWEPEELELLTAIEEIKLKYASDDYAFELMEISEGYQFLTKKQYHPTVSALIQHKAKKKLSVSQMETLAIIAYRQPISKSEVEHIRGVSCDYAVQKLLEKELIEISGKSDGPGRPVLYSTSRSFMDYFGIKSVKDLPQLKDIHVEQNEIGIPSDENAIEEETNDEIFIQETISISDESNVVPEISDVDNSETKIFAEINIESEEGSSQNTSIISEVDFYSELNEETEENLLSDNKINSFDIEAEEKITSDLIDRKSIYLENELKNQSEQEEDIQSEDEDDLP
jgi:segregation and condensation protein B